MGKKFKKITMASSNEVSLCTTYNSGANKQTEFELVKDKEGTKMTDIKPVIKQLVNFIEDNKISKAEEVEGEVTSFKDFLNYWLEYDINNAYYSLLSQALQSALCDIQYQDDVDKDVKAKEYEDLFNLFIAEYKNLPITKTQDGKFEVSLVADSHTKDTVTVPQSETDNITKEKVNDMENESMFTKAVNLLKSAISCLEKNEAPAEETKEVEAVEPAEKPADVETKEEPAEVEAPNVEDAEVEKPVEEAPAEETEKVEDAEVKETVEKTADEPAEEVEEPAKDGEEVADKPAEEVEEPAVEEPVEKSKVELEEVIKQKVELEKELEEMKKAKAEKEEQIEKMSFIQKAKDEFGMLVGTPEEVGAKLYSISKSNLDEDAKSFILEQFKKVSKTNEELTEEVGSITKNACDLTDEEKAYQQAEEIAKTKGISVNKALREIK